MPLRNALLYNNILESYKKGDWEDVLNIQAGLNESYFLWPKPTKNDLIFIGLSVKCFQANKVVSIGCGTGLLEWLISVTTGLKVVGVEIDKTYWTSKYARGLFVDLIFPEDDGFLNKISDKNSALLFCYFNNGEAFLKYLNVYNGKCLIIIGPHNIGRHTDPGPFDTNIPDTWVLWNYREIYGTGDVIAVYTKSTY